MMKRRNQLSQRLLYPYQPQPDSAFQLELNCSERRVCDLIQPIQSVLKKFSLNAASLKKYGHHIWKLIGIDGLRSRKKVSYYLLVRNGRHICGRIMIVDFRGSYRSKTATENLNFLKKSYIDLIELNKFYILIIVSIEKLSFWFTKKAIINRQKVKPRLPRTFEGLNDSQPGDKSFQRLNPYSHKFRDIKTS